MAPPLLINLANIDLNQVAYTIDDIRKIIPQRFEMELLSAIIWVNPEEDTIVGVKEVTLDEFWVRGHIPGRPLMPGVMMIECAAQLCAFWTAKRRPEMGFVGFAKCDETRFRGTVVPPNKLYMIAKMVELGHRRAVAKCQGICNGTLVFESLITGMPV